jgi:microsomal prostaglandin-E synthase 1
MDNCLKNPTFVVYVITALVLSVNLLFLWAYSGTVRARGKTAINREDSERFGAALADVDPPEVARVLRAHGNAQATIYPFLFLGLIFVLAGGTAGTATALFGIFAAARLAHSAVYLAGKQPWRTLTFIVSGLALIALMANIVWLVVQGPAGR